MSWRIISSRLCQVSTRSQALPWVLSRTSSTSGLPPRSFSSSSSSNEEPPSASSSTTFRGEREEWIRVAVGAGRVVQAMVQESSVSVNSQTSSSISSLLSLLQTPSPSSTSSSSSSSSPEPGVLEVSSNVQKTQSIDLNAVTSIINDFLKVVSSFSFPLPPSGPSVSSQTPPPPQQPQAPVQGQAAPFQGSGPVILPTFEFRAETKVSASFSASRPLTPPSSSSSSSLPETEGPQTPTLTPSAPQPTPPVETISVLPQTPKTFSSTSSSSTPSVSCVAIESPIGNKNTVVPSEVLPSEKKVDEEDDLLHDQQETFTAVSKVRKVPASRLSRLWHFGGLAAGLGVGATAEAIRRTINPNQANQYSGLSSSVFLTEANVERLATSLCKLRGAALKLGQMFSLSDNSLLPPAFGQILDRVRNSADMMPISQMTKLLDQELGVDWRSRHFAAFNDVPLAAASIGQVHSAVLGESAREYGAQPGRQVAIKIQYPGVGDSIDSDINNLATVLKLSGVLPKGLFLEKSLKILGDELKQETDYVREATCQIKMKELLKDDPTFYIPDVIRHLSTKRVLTSYLIHGITVEKILAYDQETRNFVAERMLLLCLRELFEFRFMQTDPNWANFLYDTKNKKIGLLDFGACQSYNKSFTKEYMKVVHGAAVNDTKAVLEGSIKMGFLTGFETQRMQDTHVTAVMILGEPFRAEFNTTNGGYDFGGPMGQSLTTRIQELIPLMLEERLAPPPNESYSLHRKLAGAFLLCSKLKAVVNCHDLFAQVYQTCSQRDALEDQTA